MVAGEKVLMVGKKHSHGSMRKKKQKGSGASHALRHQKLDLNGEFFAGKERGVVPAKTDQMPHIHSPPVKDKAKPSFTGNMHETSKFNKWHKGKGHKIDLARSNMRLLDPTNPEDVEKWSKNPAKFDLVDVDTPNRDTDEIEVFRGVKATQDATLQEYNKAHGLGKYWTGDVHVARLYALRGTTSISSPNSLESYDSNDKTVALVKKGKSTPWLGVLFRYSAKGKEITEYNPESYPWEQEARLGNMQFKDWGDNLADKYPKIQIGFLTGKTGRRVEWHTVQPHHEKMMLSKIMQEKPDELSSISAVKRSFKHNAFLVEQEGVLKGAKGKEVSKEYAEQLKKDAIVNTKKITVSAPKEQYTKYKLTYGEKESKLFTDLEDVAEFIKKNNVKGFNCFSPQGNIVMAEVAEGWKPHTTPPPEALKGWETFKKLGETKKKKMWTGVKAVKHTGAGKQVADFQEVFVKNFKGSSDYDAGYIDPSHIVGMFPLEYCEKKFKTDDDAVVTKDQFTSKKIGQKTYLYVKGYATSTTSYDKTFVNKAIATLGGKTKVLFWYPSAGHDHPMIVASKTANVGIAIAPHYEYG